MQNKPKRHHYVSQGYMKKFIEQPNTLYVYDKETSRIRPTSPRSIAFENDFYTVDTISEKDSSEVEESLGKIESTAIPLISELISSDNLSNPNRADLAIYIAIQYGRTPRSKALMDELATVMTTNGVKQLIADALNDETKYKELSDSITGGPEPHNMPSREKLEEWVLKPGPMGKVSIDKGTYVKSFFENASDIANGLLDSRWTVLIAPKNSTFITSDNPIALSVDRELRIGEMLAILLPGVKRYFPLDRKHCLLMYGAANSKEVYKRKANKAEVNFINNTLLEQSTRYTLSGNINLLEHTVRRSGLDILSVRTP